LNAHEEQHLQLLAIFHYVVGGLTAFFACFPLIHLTIGLAMVFGGFPGNQPQPPQFVGWLFIILGGGFFIIGQTLVICIIIAGRFLARRQTLLVCFRCGVRRMLVYAVRHDPWCVYDHSAIARIGQKCV